MRSEGYSSRSVCLFVQDYSRTTGYEVAYERYQQLQCYKGLKINVPILLKRLRSRDIVKTSEKANMPSPSINGGHAYNNNNCSDPVGISMYVQTIASIKHRTSSTSVRVGKVHLKVHNEDALDRLFPEDRIGSSESAAMSRDSS